VVLRSVVCRSVLLLRNYVVVVGGWVEFWWAHKRPWVMDLSLLGGSVGVVAFENVMVVFTAFVVSWVVSSAQGTFRRRVFLLDTI
jgi:hypothetical protein